jgi:plasmid stabilization system protein ParE
VTRVVISARALEDLRRLTLFLRESDPAAAGATPELVLDPIELLVTHPLIGRPVEGTPYRELVISRGRSGYLALYSHDSSSDEVTLHAVRHQREAGFEED